MLALTLLLLAVHGGISEEEIGSPIRVAQCRARCLQRFSAESTRESYCLQGADCYMCWENCQLLQSNFPVWGAICDEKGICFPGCKEACQFHWEESGGQRVPVKQTRGEEVLRVEGGVARWPRPAGDQPRRHYVYVLMRQAAPSRPWRQITQTAETSARVPNGGTLRLLVVDRDGLLTIYSPRPRSGLPAARAVLETLGKGALIPDLLPSTPPPSKRINTQISASPTTHRPLSILEDGRRNADKWRLHEVSLIHQKVLVIAEIAWEPPRRRLPPRQLYFVTWEVDGGGLKGNLFTDSTSVTLSLWPQTIYHIQVELVTQEAERSPVLSEELVVDTGRAVGVEVEGSPGWGGEEAPRREPAAAPFTPRLELFLGVSAALLLFLLLAALVARRPRPLPHKLLPSSPSLSTVFPPVVAVVTESSGPQRPSRTLHV